MFFFNKNQISPKIQLQKLSDGARAMFQAIYLYLYIKIEYHLLLKRFNIL